MSIQGPPLGGTRGTHPCDMASTTAIPKVSVGCVERYILDALQPSSTVRLSGLPTTLIIASTPSLRARAASSWMASAEPSSIFPISRNLHPSEPTPAAISGMIDNLFIPVILERVKIILSLDLSWPSSPRTLTGGCSTNRALLPSSTSFETYLELATTALILNSIRNRR